MTLFRIPKTKFQESYTPLRGHYHLVGPVENEDQASSFVFLSEEQFPNFSLSNTRLSPKTTVFPQSEVLLKCSLNAQQNALAPMDVVVEDPSPILVLGLRPCDAKAISLLRKNFDTAQYKDPYFLNRLNQTTFVGVACTSPCDTCFCTSAGGGGPFSEEGLDALLIPEEDSYIIKSLTPKGETFLQRGFLKGTDLEESVLFPMVEEAMNKISTTIETSTLSKKNLLDLYNAPFWGEAAFACINCGTCTFVCPTCWCFDLQDEASKTHSKRFRNWDSCMFPLFTLHTSGHNPRASKTQRFRQRFMHKLKYFIDKYEDGIMCVGCGRCVRLCPVNIDIRRIAQQMNDYTVST